MRELEADGRLLLSRHSQLRELPRDVRAGRVGLHILVDEQDLAVLANVERPALGEADQRDQDAVGIRCGLVGIAQDRIVGPERLGELLVLLRRVGAGGEVGDVEVADLVAALTERLALRGSAACERFGEPGEHHRLLAAIV